MLVNHRLYYNTIVQSRLAFYGSQGHRPRCQRRSGYLHTVIKFSLIHIELFFSLLTSHLQCYIACGSPTEANHCSTHAALWRFILAGL